MIAYMLAWKGRVLPVVVSAWALGAAACGTFVQRGSTLYEEGDYIEAAEVFEHTEGQLDDATPRDCAEYGLYRGLTLLALGDVRNAQRWLGYAYQVERQFPGTLREGRRAQLDRGWGEAVARLRPAPVAPAQPGTALAASQPPPSAAPPEPAVERGLR